MAANNTEIQYENCFVAFLDILGFKQKVIESQNQFETLQLLIDSLNLCRAIPCGGKKVYDEHNLQRSIEIQSRFFSDTIVFFLKGDKKDITHLFFVIRYLQDRLWQIGICLRGAVTIGDMYWPEERNNITVGPALIEAYELERKSAEFPRILISKELFDYINNNSIRVMPFGKKGKLCDFIRSDQDENYYLDLLNPEVIRFQNEELMKFDLSSFSIMYDEALDCNHLTILGCVNDMISQNINSTDEKIKRKYQWLKNYANNYER